MVCSTSVKDLLQHMHGVIPASRYISLTLVVLRHPVINLHVSIISGSSLEACGDLAQAGHAYSAAE